MKAAVPETQRKRGEKPTYTYLKVIVTISINELQGKSVAKEVIRCDIQVSRNTR